jgi:hypothetical protein
MNESIKSIYMIMLKEKHTDWGLGLVQKWINLQIGKRKDIAS